MSQLASPIENGWEGPEDEDKNNTFIVIINKIVKHTWGIEGSSDRPSTVWDIVIEDVAIWGWQGNAQNPVGNDDDEANQGEDLVSQYLAKMVFDAGERWWQWQK